MDGASQRLQLSEFSLSGIGRPWINDSDTVAVVVEEITGVTDRPDVIFVASMSNVQRIVDSDGEFSEFGSLMINNNGTLIFEASVDNVGRGIFTANNGLLSPFITTEASFLGFNDPAINDLEMIVFSGVPLGAPGGVSQVQILSWMR